MRRTETGFSLIELLVVITILAALAAGGTVWIRIANKRKAKVTTQQRLTSIAIGLEQVKQAVGYFPPTVTTELRGAGTKKEKVGEKIGDQNDVNVGIETVWVAFHLAGVNTAALDQLGDDALMNYDEDQANETVGEMKSLELWEIVDAWGNPIVYFHNRDYKDPSKVQKYMRADGSTVTVEVRTRDKAGGFENAQGFQLFSFGEDGEPGTEDDVVYGSFQ